MRGLENSRPFRSEDVHLIVAVDFSLFEYDNLPRRGLENSLASGKSDLSVRGLENSRPFRSEDVHLIVAVDFSLFEYDNLPRPIREIKRIQAILLSP